MPATDVLGDACTAVAAEDVALLGLDVLSKTLGQRHSCDLDRKALLVASSCRTYVLMAGDFLWQHNFPWQVRR